jgi:hypothetical protein
VNDHKKRDAALGKGRSVEYSKLVGWDWVGRGLIGRWSQTYPKKNKGVHGTIISKSILIRECYMV